MQEVTPHIGKYNRQSENSWRLKDNRQTPQGGESVPDTAPLPHKMQKARFLLCNPTALQYLCRTKVGRRRGTAM